MNITNLADLLDAAKARLETARATRKKGESIAKWNIRIQTHENRVTRIITTLERR